MVIGESGLVLAVSLLTLGYLITTITALSLSAISTNGTVKSGGAYFLLSRTLGPEFGGSIGLVFFGGTVLNGAMSLLGFSETLVANFGVSEGSVLKVIPDSSW